MLKFPIVKSANGSVDYPLTIFDNVISLTEQEKNFRVLIDTGASVPVWTKGEHEFLQRFSRSTEAEYKLTLRGFGGTTDPVKVYIVDDFILSDGNSCIHYYKLPIAVYGLNFSFDMIISYTMISFLKWEYQPGLNPLFCIEDTKQFFRMRPTFKVNNYSREMDAIAVCTQNLSLDNSDTYAATTNVFA